MSRGDALRIRLRAEALSAICQAEGVSRAEIARRLKVSPTTAYRVEHGAVEPSPRFIAALMRFSGQPFEELFEIVDTQE